MEVELSDEWRAHYLEETKYTVNGLSLPYFGWKLFPGTYDIRLQNDRLFGAESILIHSLKLPPTEWTVDPDAFQCDADGVIEWKPRIGQRVKWTENDKFKGEDAQIMDIAVDSESERVRLQFINEDIDEKWIEKKEYFNKFNVKWLSELQKHYQFAVEVGNKENIYVHPRKRLFKCKSGAFRFVPGIREMYSTSLNPKVILYAKKRKLIWCPIKALDFPLCSAPEYILSHNECSRIDREMKVLPFSESKSNGGKLSILSVGDLIVDEHGVIDGSGCGLQKGSKFKNESTPKYGEYIGSSNEEKEAEDGAGGGIIKLLCCGSIENHGVLRSEGSSADLFSGGSIRIEANGRFANSGTIDCGVNGGIDIQCTEYADRGRVNPEPTITITVAMGECLDAVHHLILKLFVTKDRIEDRTAFWNNFGSKFDEKWTDYIGRHFLLFQSTPYDGRCVLHRLVRELKIKSLVPHFRVYFSRFALKDSPFQSGSFIKLQLNGDANHLIPDETEKERLNCFAETECLFDGKSIPYSSSFIPFLPREVTVRNPKLFGDRVIWRQTFGDLTERAKTATHGLRSSFADSIELNDQGIWTLPVMAVPEDAYLRKELQLKYRRDDLWKTGSVCSMLTDKICLKSNSGDRIGFEWVNRIEFPERLRFRFKEEVENHIFSLSTDADADEASLKKKEFRFEEEDDFRLPVQSLIINDKEPQSLYVFAKPAADFKFVRVAALDDVLPFPFGAQYILTDTESVCIEQKVPLNPYDSKRDSGGTLSIFCPSEIVIADKAVIDGNGKGKDSGGGTVALMSSCGVTVKGAIGCKAADSKLSKGGSVFIASDGRFDNDGTIGCGDGGEVFIDCIEFTNSGTIIPHPMVTITDSESIKWTIDGITSWDTKERKIKLSVREHRGHYGDVDGNHPRNLLEYHGNKYYRSRTVYEDESDWITLEEVEDSPFIPKGVVIKNYNGSEGIKDIQICGGRDTKEFEDWIQINNIQKSNDRQCFPIDVVSQSIALQKQYKFFKLKILKNWGYDKNCFYEFALTTTDPRPRLVDSFVFNDVGKLMIPVTVSKNERIEENQHFKCHRNGKWMMGSVSMILTDKIQIKFRTVNRTVFDWLQRDECPKRLRFTYNREEEKQNYTFVVSTDSDADEVELTTKWKQIRWTKGDEFALSLQLLVLTQKEPQSVYIYAKFHSVDSKFIRVASLENSLHFPFGSRYILNDTETVNIDQRIPLQPCEAKYGDVGEFTLYSATPIVLTEKALIGDLERDEVKYEDKDSDEVTAKESNPNLISLISSDGVTNNGSIICKSSDSNDSKGGTAFIATDGCFENNGSIDCGMDGKVIIQCGAIVINCDDVTPRPMIKISASTGLEIPIKSFTAKVSERNLSLTVRDHRGHKNNHPPESALLPSGNYYKGQSPAKGDWIIFEIEENTAYIPTRVMIRNYDDNYAVKKIQICGGTDGEVFGEWMEIDGIRKTDDLQFFPTDAVLRHSAFVEQFKFIKLKMMENYGASNNELFGFALIGIASDQK